MRLGVDARKIVVVGESAGGGLAGEVFPFFSSILGSSSRRHPVLLFFPVN